METYLCTTILFIFCLYLVNSNPIPSGNKTRNLAERPEIILLRKYVRMNTSTPEGLEPAVEFWRQQASAAGLKFRVYSPAGLPIPVLTWEGADPALPAIMLNSHMDVVPAVPNEWKYPPYSAYMDENNDIYGRGTQDAKSTSLLYLEAIRKMKKDNVTLQRTLHITVMPDEEVGSARGMVPFRDTEDFKQLNIGFALDEGGTVSSETYPLFYQDKRPWQMKITFRGDAGHGSSMSNGTAIEKLDNMMNILMNYREKQKSIMVTKAETDYGAYTSVSINQLAGGYATNIIPSEMSLVVDMRLATATNATEFKNMFDGWIAKAGSNVTYEFIRREETSVATPTDETNPYYGAIREAAKEMNISIDKYVVPATTDMLYARARGILAFGFTTLIRTVGRYHGANEYCNADVYLNGIDVYLGIIKKLANLCG